jgi:transcriptional regulator with XRE-family HTH domain
MPRIAERYSSTPFARVLTAFMWSKAPPWSTTTVAAVLGISRSRVSNWIYKDIVPDIETMLVVLARLNIPTSALLQAYAEDGLYVPPLTVEEAQRRQQAAQTGQLPPADPAREPNPAPAPTPTSYSVPHGRHGRRSTSAPTDSSPQSELAAERSAESQADRELADREWRTILAHTRHVLQTAGMSDAAIDALLATLTADRERHRAGRLSERDRRIAEEFTVEQPHSASDSAPDSVQEQTRPSTTRSR